MRYVGLVCDYDGTLAHDGVVPASTVEALKRVARSGRRLLLATGRQLDDLLRVFPEAKIFDRLIVENGAVVYRPAQQTQKVLASKPPDSFL
jgi:HAD superfamily hydrolase (TIGR01484 family)